MAFLSACGFGGSGAKDRKPSIDSFCAASNFSWLYI